VQSPPGVQSSGRPQSQKPITASAIPRTHAPTPTHPCTHAHAPMHPCPRTHAPMPTPPMPTPMPMPAPLTPQVQRRPPWTCQTSQETTTTGGNRCWAEARFQLNRWPILKPAGKVACGRLVPALPRNLSQPRVTFPKDQHAHFQACRKSGVWTAHPGSSAATSPFQEANSSAAVSSSQATNSSAAPGYDFASQEFDYTGGLGNGDSEPAVATVKEAPAGGEKRAKKAKSSSTPSTLARATREKSWPDYGHLQNPDGTCVLKPNCSAAEGPEDHGSHVRLCDSCITYETDQQEGFECNSADVLREWCWEQDNGHAFLLGYWGRKDHRPGQQGLSRAEHLRPFAADAARRSGV
jgi:hypothetical protein